MVEQSVEPISDHEEPKQKKILNTFGLSKKEHHEFVKNSQRADTIICSFQ